MRDGALASGTCAPDLLYSEKHHAWDIADRARRRARFHLEHTGRHARAAGVDAANRSAGGFEVRVVVTAARCAVFLGQQPGRERAVCLLRRADADGAAGAGGDEWGWQVAGD